MGLIGAIFGMLGVWWGVWARNNPKASRLVCRVSESALIQGVGDDARELVVSLDGFVMPDPYLVKIEIFNAGPEDLGPSAFAGGFLRFVSPPARLSKKHMKMSMNPLSILTSTTPTHIDYEKTATGENGVAVVVDPCQLKVAEAATITVIVAGRPAFATDGRLTSFKVQEVGGTNLMTLSSGSSFPFPSSAASPSPGAVSDADVPANTPPREPADGGLTHLLRKRPIGGEHGGLAQAALYRCCMDVGMTEQEAEKLASVVRGATGFPVVVEPDGRWFAVVVTKDHSDVYTLYDQEDWQWLAKQVGSASE